MEDELVKFIVNANKAIMINAIILDLFGSSTFFNVVKLEDFFSFIYPWVTLNSVFTEFLRYN